MNHKNIPKCCCVYCTKEIYIIYLKQHIESCKSIKKYENKELYKDYVICPLCGKRLTEINNFHLKYHNITFSEFDKLYPNCRLSDEAIKNKNTLGNGKLTSEISKRLSYGHTLESYIEKYGEKEGKQKKEKSNKKLQKSKTLKGYVEKYGEKEGRKRYNKKCTKISTYSKKNWKNNYEKMKKSRTLKGYIKKYGKENGTFKWFEKNEKISESSRIIKNQNSYYLYRDLVRRISKLSIKIFGLENIETIGRNQNHIDHKISICYGFLNNIPAYVIGSIYNLEIINYKINCSKQHLNSENPEIIVNRVKNDVFYENIKEGYIKKENEIRAT